jgi:hypothetical protein
VSVAFGREIGATHFSRARPAAAPSQRSDGEFHVGTVSLENSRHRVGRQAADLLAFEARGVLTDSIIGWKRFRRSGPA